MPLEHAPGRGFGLIPNTRGAVLKYRNDSALIRGKCLGFQHGVEFLKDGGRLYSEIRLVGRNGGGCIGCGFGKHGLKRRQMILDGFEEFAVCGIPYADLQVFGDGGGLFAVRAENGVLEKIIVADEHGCFTTIGEVPNARGLVKGGGDEPVAGDIEHERVNLVLVPLEYREVFSVPGIPDVDGLVTGPGGDAFTARAEGDRLDHVVVSLEDVEQFAIFGIPNPCDGILRAGD